MTQLSALQVLRASLAIGAMAMGISAPAQAIVYDFKFTGGASGLAWTSSYFFVEVTEDLSTSASDVLFKFTNTLDEPLSVISRLYFDTGSYTSLFTGSMSIIETSLGVNLASATPASHTFFTSVALSPDYQFNFVPAVPYSDQTGINPGEYAVVKANLGISYTFDDVISAMNVGIDPTLATAVTGLRVGIFTYHLLGATNDDGGHVTKSVVSVPEAETWAMMLAGLGLVGFMARRRKA